MIFHNPGADLFVPDGTPEEKAFARVTHLGIGAHSDDLEFMAFPGIIACYNSQEKWFGGVTCTDGVGSHRADSGSDKSLWNRRQEEQRAAASLGQYAVMVQLDYSSASIKSGVDSLLTDDLAKIFLRARPEVVYTHNLADKHGTHIGIVIAVIDAIRSLPSTDHPSQLLGCEVWRSLDWMPDQKKIAQDVSGHDQLASTLNSIFESQISGGKRYDLAVTGRRRANATFLDPYASDQSDQLCFAMDLTPLIKDVTLDIIDYACGFIEEFKQDVRSQLSKHLNTRV